MVIFALIRRELVRLWVSESVSESVSEKVTPREAIAAKKKSPEEPPKNVKKTKGQDKNKKDRVIIPKPKIDCLHSR